jgi:LacI family transcriptional regulator
VTESRTPRRRLGSLTIDDVARHAGVSAMTVSRVLNYKGNVGDATREKVERSIAALNFAPSAIARSLAGNEELRIALLYAFPPSSYLSEFLIGSLFQASRSHVHLAVEVVQPDTSIDDLIHSLLQSRIRGVILFPPLCDSAATVAALTAAGLHIVAVATGRTPRAFSSVSVDDHRAAHDMTRHLIAQGHRRIGFIAGNPSHGATHRRLDGYRLALAEAGIGDDAAIVAQGLFTYRSGLDAAAQILDRSDRPSAIFASNDDMAAATVAVAHQRGLDVPRDLSVCGFDDAPLATTIWPELTTIRQPIDEMSRTTVELLSREIKGSRKGPPVQLILDHELVRRQSDTPLV